MHTTHLCTQSSTASSSGLWFFLWAIHHCRPPATDLLCTEAHQQVHQRDRVQSACRHCQVPRWSVLIGLYCICMRIYLCCLDVLIIIFWHYNLMIIAYLKTRMKWDIVIHPSPLQLCTNIQHLLTLHQKWCTIKLLVGKQWIAERSNQPLAHLRVMNIYSLYT